MSDHAADQSFGPLSYMLRGQHGVSLDAARDAEVSEMQRRHRHAMDLVDECIDAGEPIVIVGRWEGAEGSRPW